MHQTRTVRVEFPTLNIQRSSDETESSCISHSRWYEQGPANGSAAADPAGFQRGISTIAANASAARSGTTHPVRGRSSRSAVGAHPPGIPAYQRRDGDSIPGDEFRVRAFL